MFAVNDIVKSKDGKKIISQASWNPFNKARIVSIDSKNVELKPVFDAGLKNVPGEGSWRMQIAIAEKTLVVVQMKNGKEVTVAPAAAPAAAAPLPGKIKEALEPLGLRVGILDPEKLLKIMKRGVYAADLDKHPQRDTACWENVDTGEYLGKYVKSRFHYVGYGQDEYFPTFKIGNEAEVERHQGVYKPVQCKNGGRRNARKSKRALRNRRRYSRKN